MDALTLSKQMADGLKRLASKRQKADTAATSAREDFLRAVEVARAEGATVEEIGWALGVSRERIHQLLG
jgi:DNA-directed RNA polymerase sigma subunit (sigma70/sigma32)